MSSSSAAIAAALPRFQTPPPSPSSPNHIQIQSPIPRRPASASLEQAFLVRFHDVEDDDDAVLVDRASPPVAREEQAPLLAKAVGQVAKKSSVLGIDLPEEPASLLEKGITPIPLPENSTVDVLRYTSPAPETTNPVLPLKVAFGAVAALVVVVACVVLVGKRGS